MSEPVSILYKYLRILAEKFIPALIGEASKTEVIIGEASETEVIIQAAETSGSAALYQIKNH